MHQAGLRRLQFARIAAAALDVEEQVVAAQQLGHVGLQGDEIGRILGVPPDRNGPGDVPVQHAERTAEQVDARGDHRRPDLVVFEHERLDQIVEVALVIRDVDDAAAIGGAVDVVGALGDPLDLAQDWVERMLQRPVNRVALGGPQLVEVGVDPFAGLRAGFAGAAAQVAGHLLPRQHGLGDLVLHQRRTISEVTMP